MVESPTLWKKLEQAVEEVLSLRGQKGDALEHLSKLQTKIDNQTGQLQDMDTEISHLTNQITKMKGIIKRQDDLADHKKSKLLKLEFQVASNRQEIAHLKAKNHKFKVEISVGEEKKNLHRFTPDQDPTPTHPIIYKEKYTLIAGVANNLLNELQRDMPKSNRRRQIWHIDSSNSKRSLEGNHSSSGHASQNRDLPSDYEAHQAF